MADPRFNRNAKWPAWRYGPDGQEKIFQSEKDVPAGWEDHPSKVKIAPVKAKSVTKKSVKAAALDAEAIAEARREELFARAKELFNDVPEDATIEELEEHLNSVAPPNA